MLRVRMHLARPGMVLALPVRDPGNPKARSLLHAGYRLTEQMIKRLNDLKVHELWVKYPPLNFIDKFVNPEVMVQRAVLVNKIRGAFEIVQGRSNAKLQFADYCRAVAGLVDQLLADPTAVLFLDEMSVEDSRLLDHSSKVAYLSVLMGLKLEAYLIKQRARLTADRARDVSSIGLGAMLHDLGVLKLEDAVRDRREETGDEADPEWQQHVQLGYEIVQGEIDPSAAVCLLHHHQTFDGKGYPTRKTADGRMEPLAGEQIHIGPRIVAAADAFDTLQHAEDPPRPTVSVLRELIEEPWRSRFDPEVLRALLMVVPPYPPGTMLRLSDGQWAVAVDHSVENPCRPLVRLIEGPDVAANSDEMAEDDAEELTIDLNERPDLEVVEAGEESVAGYNFPPPRFMAGAGHTLIGA